jgi:hypothetical protein
MLEKTFLPPLKIESKMTLSITLFDQFTNSLAKAKVLIRYRTPNKKLWQSGWLESSPQGVVSYPFEPGVFEQVDFSRATYFIEYQGQKFAVQTSTLPTQKDMRLHLHAQKLDISTKDEPGKDDKKPDNGPNAPLTLRITVKTEKNAPLKSVPLRLTYAVKGQDGHLDLGTTSPKGVLDYSTTIGVFATVTAAGPTLMNTASGVEFDILSATSELLEPGLRALDWTVSPRAQGGIKDPKEPEIGETPAPPQHGALAQVFGTLLQDNAPVSGQFFGLRWTRRDGLIRNIFLPKTSGKGEFLWTGSAVEVAEATFFEAQLYDVKNNLIYAIERTEAPSRDGDRLIFTWHVRKTEQEVAELPDLNGGDAGLIFGTVTATDGRPQKGLVIRAFDVDFPDEKMLGEVETDNDGFYAINYAAGTAKDREKDALDLVVRAYPPGSGENDKPLVETLLLANAPIRVQIDVVTGDEVWEGTSLYERIMEAVLPELKGARLHQITPAAIALLAARTRYDIRELGFFFGAWVLAIGAGNAPTNTNAAAPYFGWVMDGLPPQPIALALQPPERLHEAIKNAIAKNFIPQGQYDYAVEAAQNARTTLIAQHQPDIVAYLKAGGLNDAQAGKVIGVFLDGLDVAGREEVILAQLGNTKGPIALHLIEIWRAIGGNTRLGTAILAAGQTQVPRDLVELTANKLAQLARNSDSVPLHIAGTSVQARAATYAVLLLRGFENRYPIAFFAHQLSLSAHGETKRLGNRLKTSLQMQPPSAGAADPVITGGWDQELVNLASLYFSAVPARRAPLVEQLIREGFLKAPDITTLGLTNFRGRMKQKLAAVGELSDADTVFQRAANLVAVANAVKMQEITEQMPGDDVPATLSGQLFQGSINGACPHCKSMTSPSAYLLDVVRYISRATAGANKSGWDRVDARRPDLKNVDLTCANSDRVMPYIDLVLELLEDQVERWNDQPRQTLASVEELAERPQYVNAKAYRALMNRVFPWAAQYNRDFDLTRRAMAQAGLPLPGLADATAAGGDAAWLSVWDASMLRLESAGAKVAPFYGVANLNKLRENISLSALARHLQIGAEPLLAMLNTAFVNPGDADLVAQNGTLDWSRITDAMLGRLALLGQMQAHSGGDLGRLEHWLRVVDPTRAGWQTQLAAGLRMAQRHRLKVADVEALLQADGPLRLAQMAKIVGISPTAMGTIAGAIPADPARPVGLDALLRLAHQLGDAGTRDVDALLALIAVPEAGGMFDPNTAAKALDTLSAAYSDAFGDVTGAPGSEEMTLVAETLAAAVQADAGALHLLPGLAGLILSLRDRAASADQVMRLWKQAHAITALGLEADDIKALPVLVQKFKLIDTAALPTGSGAAPDLSALAALIALADMNARLYRYEGSLFTRLADATNQLASLRAALALPDLSAVAIAALLGSAGLAISTTRDLLDAGRIADLTHLMGACHHLGTDGATLLKAAAQFDGELAWTLAKARSAPSVWPRAARQISDPLRERCRDALLAEVIHASRRGQSRGFDGPEEVYSHFLVDPEMMAVVDTSRIKQAAASLQQFVQRVQLGLEPGVVFSQNDASQWVWRRNYRVWEANRKVLVFPENWIRPELRDNKTTLYLELESNLLKDDVRAETAEDALLNYARGLHQVAGLEMVAMHEDDDTHTTYVVGRTREAPHRYFFTARGSNGLWSGWEKVDIEIEGDHVIPIVYARRIFLAWVTFDPKVAVEDETYIDRLSELESDQNFVRDEIDTLKRKIADLENKRDENAKYLDNNWQGVPGGSNFAALYQQLATYFEQNIAAMSIELSTRRGEEKRIIRDMNRLQQEFTYCDVTLSISQRKRNGGWEPIIRSKNGLKTLQESAPSQWSQKVTRTFYHDVENFYVDVDADGKDLTFDVNRGQPSTNEQVRSNHMFGHFKLDVVNNVLTSSGIQRGMAQGARSVVIYKGRTDRQRIAVAPGVAWLEVLDSGREAVLRNVDSSTMRVIPNAFEDGSALIFEQGQRSYLVEKASFSPPPHSNRAANLLAKKTGDADAALPTVGLAAGDSWRFTPLYHPFSEVIVTELYRYGLEGLYVPDAASGRDHANMLTRQSARRENFDTYAPTVQVARPHPVEAFSFSRTNPYGVYNWELFFHAPYAVAEYLRQNRRFEDARRWYHFIFNPTDKDQASLAGVWRFGPFHREHLRILAGDTPDLMDEADNPDFTGQVEEWEQNPFNPHAVARIRTVAYMRAIYMAYIENLIDWGDDLFRRDTMESINEAAQLYVFAAEMLGPRPVIMPDIDDGTAPKSLGEALSWAPSLARVIAAGRVEPHPDNLATGSAFLELFGDFCMPTNDNLLGIWARLADRMFKIRNSLNIDGTFRKLALFEPPIDPALLVRAAAAGLSLGDAIAGLSARRPYYRFTFMVTKALDFASDVRSLGAALLSALEKRDAEALSKLRASHEVAMSRQMRAVLEDRIKEAGFAISGLDAELDRAVSDALHYDTLISLGDLPEEREELTKLAQAHGYNQAAGAYQAIGTLLSVIPQFGMSGMAPQTDFGGLHLANLYRGLGEVMALVGADSTFAATMAGRTAGRQRRTQDWGRAKENATQTIKRLQQDRLAAEIRLAIAEKDLEQHDTRIAQALEAETFLKDKFTNEALYGWIVDRLSGLHFQAYKLASDLARQAETCFRDELSDDSASFVDPGAWDSLRKGLLAGEQLTLDLRRMEAAYLASNRRLHELRKSVSLAQVDALALLSLRRTGTCSFDLAEYLFDLDHPGHLNRRIKSVNITLPALAGPQTAIPCTLSLVQSFVRRVGINGAATLQPGRSGEAMATSTGQNDSGMFQFDFQDPRYLKFEGAGAVSTWEVTLPEPAVAQFDYGSITDLIIEVFYMAEDGTPDHISAVKTGLRGALVDLGHQGKALFSLRYDFPETWARLKNQDDLRSVTLGISNARVSHVYANRPLNWSHLSLVSIAADAVDVVEHNEPLSVGSDGIAQLQLPGAMRDALNGSVRDILVVCDFTAGPVQT